MFFVRNYWGSHKDETIQNMPCYLKSLLKVQERCKEWASSGKITVMTKVGQKKLLNQVKTPVISNKER